MCGIQRSTHLCVLFAVVHKGDGSARQGRLYYEGTLTLTGYLVSNLHNVPGLAPDMHQCILVLSLSFSPAVFSITHCVYSEK